MNKQTKINVKGSKNLIMAFIEEISSMGWKGITSYEKENCIEKEQLAISKFSKEYSDTLYSPKDNILEFNLPQDWPKAIKAFKNYDKVEYKVGDFVYHLPGFDNMSRYSNNYGGAGYKEGSVTQIMSIDRKGSDNSVLWFKNWLAGVYTKAVRLATPEEIEKAQKPQEIIVKCKYSDGEFDVKVKAGTENMSSEDGIFTIGAIQDIYTLMIDPASCTENEVHTGNTWEIEFPYVNVGCKKMVPLSSINDIIVAWGKLNNKR